MLQKFTSSCLLKRPGVFIGFIMQYSIFQYDYICSTAATTLKMVYPLMKVRVIQ